MPDAVLYPLDYLKFNYITLKSWKELPQKLLYIAKDLVDHPQVCTFLLGSKTCPGYFVAYQMVMSYHHQLCCKD